MNLNWTSFITITGGCYAAYYLSLILMDSFSAKTVSTANESPVMTFSETQPAEKVSPEDFKPASKPAENPASVGLGGVTMKAFYELAQADALQYTRSVSF